MVHPAMSIWKKTALRLLADWQTMGWGCSASATPLAISTETTIVSPKRLTHSKRQSVWTLMNPAFGTSLVDSAMGRDYEVQRSRLVKCELDPGYRSVW